MLQLKDSVQYKNIANHVGIITKIKTVNDEPLYMVEWDDAECFPDGRKQTIGYSEKDLVKL